MKLRVVATVFLASLIFTARSEAQHFSTTGKGALIGGALGLDAGAAIGWANGRPLEGAVVGAGVGALAGAGIGYGLERRDRGWPAAGYGDPYYYGNPNYYGDPSYYGDPYYQQRFWARHHRHHHRDFDEDEDEDEDD